MMKKNCGEIIKLFLFILMMSLSLTSMATTYYISNAGSDSNSGLSTNLPWKTLAKVNATTFKPGDQILFQRGSTFYGSLTLNQSGVSGSPITFAAYDTGANPVITGFTNITNWTDLGGNIWESTNAVSSLSNCNMVTFNGVNTAMGRYPDVNAANGGYLTFQSSSASSITSSDLTGTPNWTGAQILIRNSCFTIQKTTVTSQSAGTLNFAALSKAPSAGNGFFIENDIRCCNQQNEWYYNPSTKKIRVASSSQPLNVNLASIDNLITINANYLNFENMTFTGANLCAIYRTGGSNVSVLNCIFTYTGLSAMYGNFNYLDVENCNISESNCNAISTLYGTNITIRNNTIKNIGVLLGMRNQLPDPMSLANSCVELDGGSNHIIEYNTIQNVGYNGITASSALIKNNFINTFCTMLDDGGGIYGCHNSVITGNIVINGIGTPYGVANRFPAAGIYLDQGSHDVEVSYNTVANCYKYGFFIASLGNVNSHHNTAYNASEIQYHSVFWGWPGTSPTTTDKINNNIFVAKTKDGTDISSNQKCLGFYFVNSSGNSSNNPGVILASATLDSNYYARPIGQDKVIFLNVPVWADCWKTLEEWQSYSGKDAHSHKSPQAITSTNDFQFEYNATKATKIVYLNQAMTDVKGNKYVGCVTLQPFTSVVLMKDYNAAEVTSFTLPGQVGSSSINLTSKVIGVTMPSGTSPTNLSASFTLSPGATAKVGTIMQVSGTTANNFTNPVVYVVTSNDGLTVKSWTVKVTISAPTQDGISDSTSTGELQTPLAVNPITSGEAESTGIKNYPNPFVESTTFEFSVKEKSDVFLDIYDLQGKKLIELVNQQYEAGIYKVIWNGTNQRGQRVSPGIYIYTYRAGNFVCSKKIYVGD